MKLFLALILLLATVGAGKPYEEWPKKFKVKWGEVGNRLHWSHVDGATAYEVVKLESGWDRSSWMPVTVTQRLHWVDTDRPQQVMYYKVRAIFSWGPSPAWIWDPGWVEIILE